MLSVSELKAYMTERGTVSETEIALHFKTTAPVIAMMAERLEQKGVLRQTMIGGCKTNCGCSESPKRAWFFVGKA